MGGRSAGDGAGDSGGATSLTNQVACERLSFWGLAQRQLLCFESAPKGCFYLGQIPTVLIAIILASGCSSDEQSPPQAAAEVLIDRNEIRAQEPRLAYLIGSLDGVGEPAFGNITDIAVTPDEEIVVLDGTAQVAYLVDEMGKEWGTIGRAGQGPGEFRFPFDAQIVDGDQVEIVDPALSRVTWFDLDGTVIRTANMPAQGQFGQPADMAIASDGSVFNLGFDQYQQSLEVAMTGRRRGAVRGINIIQRWSEGAEQWINLAEIPGLEVYVDQDAQRIQDLEYARAPLWAPHSNGGFWVADNHSPVIHRFSADGHKISTTRLPVQAVALSAEERRAYYAAEDLSDRSAERQRRARSDRKYLPLPETKPLLKDLVTGIGTLWIGLESPGAKMREWIVLDHQGQLYRRYLLPTTFSPHTVQGDSLYGVSLGPLGVNRVAVFQLSDLRSHSAAALISDLPEVVSPFTHRERALYWTRF